MFEKDIMQYFSEQGEIQNLNFYFVPHSRFEKIIKNIPGLYYFFYNLWHRRAYRLAKKLEKKLHFNLVHQVNMCGFREPGYLWKLKTPFIWGPVGGTQNYPWRFLALAGIRGAIKEGLRTIINIFQFRFSPRVCIATKRAHMLLVANSIGLRDFRRVHKATPILELDVGAVNVTNKLPTHDRHKEPIRILWSGLLKHHKALHLLLLSLSKLPNSVPYQLKILGKGPLEKRWQRLARCTGAYGNCTWTGWLSHDEAMAQYDWADALRFFQP